MIARYVDTHWPQAIQRIDLSEIALATGVRPVILLRWLVKGAPFFWLET
jgi:hypothetical protein